MFAFYIRVLGLNVGIANFVLLMMGLVNDGLLKTRDFLFCNAILFVGISLIFISLDLFATGRRHDADSRLRNCHDRISRRNKLWNF